MRGIYRFATFISTAFLCACAIAPIPIDNIAYSGKTTVKSVKDASVITSSSGIGGSTSTRIMPVGGTYVAIQDRSSTMPFDEKDQQEFAKSLRTELTRLGIVRTAVGTSDANTDLSVVLQFERARLDLDPVKYTLDVALTISGGEKPFQKRYHVVSSENDSFWEKLNTNGAEARFKVAKLLLERLIPDIDAYVGAMQPNAR